MKQQTDNADITVVGRQPAAERVRPVSADSSEIQAEVAKVAYQLSKERRAEGDLAERDWRRARVIVLERLAAKNLVSPM
jgi:hypothetical protein